MIIIFKILLQNFKAHSNLSKYADEILRILIMLQECMNEREANKCFYSLFVKSGEECLPVDLKIEHIVKTAKKQIKHMYSNKTEENILKKSSAL